MLNWFKISSLRKKRIDEYTSERYVEFNWHPTSAPTMAVARVDMADTQKRYQPDSPQYLTVGRGEGARRGAALTWPNPAPTSSRTYPIRSRRVKRGADSVPQQKPARQPLPGEGFLLITEKNRRTQLLATCLALQDVENSSPKVSKRVAKRSVSWANGYTPPLPEWRQTGQSPWRSALRQCRAPRWTSHAAGVTCQ